MIASITLREFKNFFISPLAWVILAVTQAIMAWMFLAQIESFYLLQPQLIQLENAPGVTDLVIAPFYSLAAIIFLMMTPLLTMRSFAEEKHNKTLTLLLSSPAHLSDIVLGKFLALFLFIFIIVTLLSCMPLALSIGTSLDFGKLASAYLGTLLLVSSFAAIGLFLSSLSHNTTIAAITTFGVLIFLWMVDWVGNQSNDGILNYLSLLKHQQPLIAGIFNSVDIVYYLILIGLFLSLTVQQLDAERRLA